MLSHFTSVVPCQKRRLRDIILFIALTHSKFQVIQKMVKACRGYESWKKKNDPDHMPWLWPDQITSDLIGELKTATCISIHEIRYIKL